MEQQTDILGSILTAINDLQITDLDKYLKNDVEWESIEDTFIIPQNVRKFIKRINDKEVRLDVAKFLHKYARQYFREAAERQEYNEKMEDMLVMGGPAISIKTADERIALFQQELAFLLDQDESTGEFSGDRFKKQAKKIEDLEKQVEELKAENENLSTQLYYYQHPRENGKHIPEELNKTEFYNIMTHLVTYKIVRTVSEPDEMGIHRIVCYQWDASKALFGYFIERMNEVLEIRGARVPLNWKVFRPAINNYDKLIDEARKALSTYNNSSILQKNRIENAEIVDKAIEDKEFPF